MSVMGPGIHYWNRILEYCFFGWDPVHAVVAKVLLDQSLFTVPSLCSTVAAVTWAEQKALSQIPARVRSQLWPLLVANWKVWGPTMCFVYAFVQEDLRPLVLNVVSIGWQIFYLMLLREPPKSEMPKSSDEITADRPSSEDVESATAAAAAAAGEKPSSLSLGPRSRSFEKLQQVACDMAYLPSAAESALGSPGGTARGRGRGDLSRSRGSSLDLN